MRAHPNGLISGVDKRESQSPFQLFCHVGICSRTVYLFYSDHLAVHTDKSWTQVGDAHDESHVSFSYARDHLIGHQNGWKPGPYLDTII